MRYAKALKEIAIQNKSVDDESFGNFYIAYSLFQQDKLDTALRVLRAISDNYKKTIPPIALYNKIYQLKSNVYIRTQRYDDMIKSGYDWLRFSEQSNDTIGLISAYVMIGNANYHSLKKRESINWYLKGYELIKNDDKTQFISIYNNLGGAYAELSQEDSAYFFLNKGIEVCKSVHNDFKLSQILNSYSGALIQFKKLRPAEQAINQAIEIQEKIGNFHQVTSNMIQLGSIYSKIPEPEKGIKVCLQALELYKKLPEDISLKTLAYQALADNYEAAGDYKNLSKTLKTIHELSDSIYTKHVAQSFAEMQTKYETQKKETTILQQQYELTKRNYLLYGTIGLALLSLVAARIFFVQYHKKQQLKLQLMHAEEQHQLNQAIAAAKESERKRIAADLHDNIGAQLSYISSNINFVLDAPQKMSETDEKHFLGMVNDTAKTAIIDLRETIWALNKDSVTFLEFADKLKMYLNHHLSNQQVVQLHISENVTGNMQLSSAEAIHIFRIMQEAAGNSVKHAAASTLQLSINATANKYSIRLSDNGKGFDVNATYDNHYGLENMQKRAAEIGAVLQIESTLTKGTTILLEKEMKS
ncbi:MAG: sensor histidine kinase [Chitinophagaceae bacterium]